MCQHENELKNRVTEVRDPGQMAFLDQKVIFYVADKLMTFYGEEKGGGHIYNIWGRGCNTGLI